MARLRSVAVAVAAAGVLVLGACAPLDETTGGVGPSPTPTAAPSTTEGASRDAATPTSTTATTAPGSDASSDPSSSTTETPASDPPPPPTAPSTELDRLVAELVPFVERERGHAFTRAPTVETLDSEAFTAAYAAVVQRDVERQREDFADFTDIYRALGIIDGSRDLAEIFTDFADAGAIGFYDPETERVVVRGGEITALTETVLVHELVHALDDQLVGIDRPEYDDRDDEIAWTFSALLEGNATVIENRYRATFDAAQQVDETRALLSLSRGVSLADFSDSFVELQFSRYRLGTELAEELWAEGVAAVDVALLDPPTTSELVVERGSLLAAEPPDPGLAPPPADAEPFEDGIFGLVGWAALLRDAMGPEEAYRAARGWGGDWFVAWREGPATCVRADIAADTPADLDEYAAALERWARGGDREVYYPTADLVRVTACG